MLLLLWSGRDHVHHVLEHVAYLVHDLLVAVGRHLVGHHRRRRRRSARPRAYSLASGCLRSGGGGCVLFEQHELLLQLVYVVDLLQHVALELVQLALYHLE